VPSHTLIIHSHSDRSQ